MWTLLDVLLSVTGLPRATLIEICDLMGVTANEPYDNYLREVAPCFTVEDLEGWQIAIHNKKIIPKSHLLVDDFETTMEKLWRAFARRLSPNLSIRTPATNKYIV